MKKPAGVTKEQWAKYKKNLDLALGVMNKSLDLVADINFEAGEIVERDRIIKLVTDSKVINGDQKHFLLAAIKGEQK
jgi:hypothetical protein